MLMFFSSPQDVPWAPDLVLGRQEILWNYPKVHLTLIGLKSEVWNEAEEDVRGKVSIQRNRFLLLKPL